VIVYGTHTPFTKKRPFTVTLLGILYIAAETLLFIS